MKIFNSLERVNFKFKHFNLGWLNKYATIFYLLKFNNILFFGA